MEQLAIAAGTGIGVFVGVWVTQWAIWRREYRAGRVDRTFHQEIREIWRELR